jgi:hypothetical protein
MQLSKSYDGSEKTDGNFAGLPRLISTIPEATSGRTLHLHTAPDDAIVAYTSVLFVHSLPANLMFLATPFYVVDVNECSGSCSRPTFSSKRPS